MHGAGAGGPRVIVPEHAAGPHSGHRVLSVEVSSGLEYTAYCRYTSPDLLTTMARRRMLGPLLSASRLSLQGISTRTSKRETGGNGLDGDRFTYVLSSSVLDSSLSKLRKDKTSPSAFETVASTDY